ncbi:ATP-binding protein [Kouleothrix sp.]|uniref:ATP-binding protein n=1 Tax=Kouleothrix sp. TaxID=2779161 RepID=UPI00391CDC9C
MADDLRIQLLGPLAIWRGARALPESAWRSRQERRLLGILLAARGRRVPAEQLIEWLWPDAAHGAAATNLRSTVSALRHLLEPASGRASSRYILTRPGGYAWNPAGGAWIDAEEFLALLDRRDTPADTTLEQALALYGGDYLADEPDAPWAATLRELLRERFLAALHDLAELRLAQGAYDAAGDLARRGLAHDRLREPLYRTLMSAQARAGDLAGALQTYERCRRALDDDLGVAPSAQTRELHSALLRDERGQAPARYGEAEARRHEAGDQRAASVTARLPAARTSAAPAASSPFVGRAGELAALRDWIAALDGRRGGVVAVVGEAGIGKTRLIDEALRAAGGQRFTIALRCTPLERGLPFAPLSEALRPLLRTAPLELLRRLPPVALAQVADLLPVLRERLPDLPTLPGGAAEGHNYLLDGIVDLALALAREGPLIVWCDDAHWADEATIAALGRLARHAPRHALLIVLAYRSEELVDNTALHQLLRALGREMSPQPLLLGRLAERDVAALLAGLAGTDPMRVSHLALRLSAASSGNPLVLGVALQSLVEAHGARSLAALLPSLGTEAPLPDLASAPPLRDLVLARVERLPGPARELLEQLAVIGRPASLDLIEQLAGAEALSAAQMLLERQFLAEGADGRLGFGHDLVRSIVGGALSSPRRRLLHRRAAEAIAALHGAKPARAAELAFHFEQAGRGAEAESLRYAIGAGDHARRAFGYRAALAHYDSALRAAERMGAQAPADLVRRAFVGRLLIVETLLDWDGVLETAARYERWRALLPGQPALLPPRRLAVLRALMGDLAEAAVLSRAHDTQPANVAPALADLQQRTAMLLQPVAAERLDQARPVAGESFVPFQPAPDPPGNPAADLPEAMGAEPAALALFQVGWATLMQGLAGAAEPCLLRAHALAIDTSQAAVAVISALQLAHLSALRGDTAATERWLATSLATAERAPEAAWASIWPRIHQAFLLLLDDKFADARALFEALAAQLGDLPAFASHRAGVEVGLGLLDLAAGNQGRAATRLQAAMANPQALYGFVYAAAQHGLARIAASRGDLPGARMRLAHTLDYSARRGLLPEYIRTAIEIARIERDFGEPALAVPQLQAAAALADSAGFKPLAAAAHALLARLAPL